MIQLPGFVSPQRMNLPTRPMTTSGVMSVQCSKRRDFLQHSGKRGSRAGAR
jgi:hypothetical protein